MDNSEKYNSRGEEILKNNVKNEENALKNNKRNNSNSASSNDSSNANIGRCYNKFGI